MQRLHPRVREWIHRQGWPGLRDVQASAVAPILERDGDIVISAGTAAGKTEAAFLPIASVLAEGEERGIRALCVSPLKALIDDQFRRLEELGDVAGFPVQRWHGDVGQGERRRTLDAPGGLLLITPESLEALHVLRGQRLAELFGRLEYVVVDELHAFLGSERGVHLASLLHRIESRVVALGGEAPMRVGLSATLGEPDVARRFLRPGAPERVALLEAEGGAREVRLALRSEGAARRHTVQRLFRELRGGDHLLFCNRRADVEDLAARLGDLSLEENVPDEFVAHHGSLSAELRRHAEAALKDPDRPRTVICTSTLELGIDVGDVDSVVQLGAPASVGALKQRLGRSGRRGGPATLRLIVESTARDPEAPPTWVDRLDEELVQAVAMLELLLEGWCETPPEGALHLSTLAMQVISVVAERSGAKAGALFRLLCETGPFRAVDADTFRELLQAMGERELLAQDADGDLLTGPEAERLLDDFRFYAAFHTPEEVSIVTRSGEVLGRVPVLAMFSVGDGLVFGGVGWRVVAANEEAKEVVVVPGSSTAPPTFQGSGADVDDVVRAKMREVLDSSALPAYLDARATERLLEARAAFAEEAGRALVRDGGSLLYLPWCGDRALRTLALALRAHGLDVARTGAALRLYGCTEDEAWQALGDLDYDGPPDPLELASAGRLAAREKYDEYLDRDLLTKAIAKRDLDVEGAWRALRRTLG